MQAIHYGAPTVTDQDRPFQMRLSGDFLARLDEWRLRQPESPSRAEAVRRLTTAILQILDKDPDNKGAKPKKRKAG